MHPSFACSEPHAVFVAVNEDNGVIYALKYTCVSGLVSVLVLIHITCMRKKTVYSWITHEQVATVSMNP